MIPKRPRRKRKTKKIKRTRRKRRTKRKKKTESIRKIRNTLRKSSGASMESYRIQLTQKYSRSAHKTRRIPYVAQRSKNCQYRSLGNLR